VVDAFDFLSAFIQLPKIAGFREEKGGSGEYGKGEIGKNGEWRKGRTVHENEGK